MEHENWNGFIAGRWQDEINVRDFIQQNYKEYTGDAAFLAEATPRTKALMKKLEALFALERQFGGVLDIDTTTVSSLTSYSPGYLDTTFLSESSFFNCSSLRTSVSASSLLT